MVYIAHTQIFAAVYSEGLAFDVWVFDSRLLYSSAISLFLERNMNQPESSRSHNWAYCPTCIILMLSSQSMPTALLSQS